MSIAGLVLAIANLCVSVCDIGKNAAIEKKKKKKKKKKKRWKEKNGWMDG